MSAGPSLKLGAKQISQLHAALVGAFNAIIHFLNRMADHPHCQVLLSYTRCSRKSKFDNILLIYNYDTFSNNSKL